MAITKPFVTSRRFVSTAGAGTGTGAAFAIAATAFTDDAGAAATVFPTFTYYNLYINGVLQLANTSTASTTGIGIPGGNVLDSGVPIIVVFVIT
ncbi:DUF4183 domain-containing protein [Brevibacillus laterosporus]|uniref:DUF4183 domain-containing protein n=1 Tax=Brevibacillus laterosporus TaxID=1465 RepID=UPI000E6C2579|nr:DUF4183 domain-containing protein [Brevibacillus laterosporus]AYB41306.1 DUF4183 domain-containing protein [Brevibacillus laterosporus]MBM7110278.1 hypothetical protein [Brevibacillus laterosporus]